MKYLKNIFITTIALITVAVLTTPLVSWAVQISVPSAPTSGYSIVSTSTGAYQAIQNNTANGLLQLSATSSIVNVNNVQSVTGTITSGKTLNAFGDSITAGFGLTSSSSVYINLMSGYENWSFTNYAQGGETAADQADEIYGITTSTSTNATYMIGANDSRQANFQTTSGLQDFQNIDLAELAWLAIPSDKKFIGTDTTDISYGGTWVTSPNFAIGRESTTNASTASTTVYGSSVIIGAESYGSSAGKGGTYTVEIDGTTYGPYSDQFNTNISSINFARNYAPTAIIIPNLPLQNHSVLVTVTSGTSASNPVFVDWISGVNGSQFTAGPEVYTAGVLRLSASGYATWGTNITTGTNFNNVIKNNTSYLASLGLNVSFVDVSSYLNQTTDLQADGLHPNAQGDVKLAQAFEAATNGFEYSHDRQASQKANVSSSPTSYTISTQVNGSALYTPGLTVTSDGSAVNNVGIGTTTPADALTIQYAATGGQYGMTLANTNRTNYDLIRLLGTGSQYWTYGMGNDLEGTFGVANTFFVFDGISNAFPFTIAPITDNVGIGGTTTPAMKLSVNGNSLFHGTLTQDTLATSSFADGINLTSGCFAVNGSCISGGGGGGSGTVNSGTSGQVAYYASNGTVVSGTSTLTIASNSDVGIGTTSPYMTLSLVPALNTSLVIGVDPSLTSTVFSGTKVPVIRDVDSGGSYLTAFDGALGVIEPLTGHGFIPNPSLSFLSRDGTKEGDIVFATSTNQLQFQNASTYDFVGANVGINDTSPNGLLSLGSGLATNKFLVYDGGSSIGSEDGITQEAGEMRYFTDNDLGANDAKMTFGYYNGSSAFVQNATLLGNGNFGIGTTTPRSLLSVGNTNGINFSTGTSTFSSTGGINLAAGCFAVNGTCISGGGGGSGTVNSGTTGQFPFYASSGTTLTATSTLFLSTGGSLGVGTSTPVGALDVNGGIYSENQNFTGTSQSIDFSTARNTITIPVSTSNITLTFTNANKVDGKCILARIAAPASGSIGSTTFAGGSGSGSVVWDGYQNPGSSVINGSIVKTILCAVVSGTTTPYISADYAGVQ